MLRIISKTAQQDAQLSLAPGSPLDAYRKPAQFVKNVVRQKGENKRQRDLEQASQQGRDQANGPCRDCGQFLARDQAGRRFCPLCPARPARSTTRPVPPPIP